jgi:predicted 3-demethylubiquinone-9 3-methyltransferase (glyoxalase superfamily)
MARPAVALNGGPLFKFNEAVSLMVQCKDQAEIDYFWEKLGEGGDPKKQACGWLADKYGLSWQIVPARMDEFMAGEDAEGRKRAFGSMMDMTKLDIDKLEGAYHNN